MNKDFWRRSSAGQSVRFTSERSQVRAPLSPPKKNPEPCGSGFFAVSGILPQELPCPSFSRHRAYRAAGGSAGFHAGTCGKEGAAFGICKQAGRQDACMARAGGRVFAGRGFERGLAGACAPPRRASGGAKPCGSKRKRAPAPLFLPQRGAAAAFWKEDVF